MVILCPHLCFVQFRAPSQEINHIFKADVDLSTSQEN